MIAPAGGESSGPPVPRSRGESQKGLGWPGFRITALALPPPLRSSRARGQSRCRRAWTTKAPHAGCGTGWACGTDMGHGSPHGGARECNPSRALQSIPGVDTGAAGAVLVDRVPPSAAGRLSRFVPGPERPAASSPPEIIQPCPEQTRAPSFRGVGCLRGYGRSAADRARHPAVWPGTSVPARKCDFRRFSERSASRRAGSAGDMW